MHLKHSIRRRNSFHLNKLDKFCSCCRWWENEIVFFPSFHSSFRHWTPFVLFMSCRSLLKISFDSFSPDNSPIQRELSVFQLCSLFEWFRKKNGKRSRKSRSWKNLPNKNKMKITCASNVLSTTRIYVQQFKLILLSISHRNWSFGSLEKTFSWALALKIRKNLRWCLVMFGIKEKKLRSKSF